MKMTADNKNKITTKIDDDSSADYYSSNRNKIIKISKRQLVTRDGKHRSGTWTHIEGCYSLQYEPLLRRRRKKFSAGTDDEIEYYDDESN